MLNLITPPMNTAAFAELSPRRLPLQRGLPLSRWLSLWLLSIAICSPAVAQDASALDLRMVRAKAIRQAVAVVADSVLRVELVGVAQAAGGEVAEDAPTVAVAIDDQRHFIASSMVVRGKPTSILLVTPDGRRVVAEVVARDHSRQLVLLRAGEAVGAAPLELSAVEPTVGQSVVAVGRHSDGEAPAISTGILSATKRNWGLALQTDARVSSGFYGGPLIDLYGRVLGIVVPMVPDGGAEDETGWYDAGIAFAIPVGDIQQRLPQLIAGQDIHPGVAGIVARDSDPYVSSTEIAAVRPRSPAARADLHPGDEITSIADTPVSSHREVKQLLGPLDAGATVAVVVKRGDEVLEKSLQLAQSIPPLVPQQLGITAAALPGDDQDDSQEAVIVVSGVIQGTPAEGQLAVGDRIRALGENVLGDLPSLRRQVFTADPDAPLKLSIVRGAETLNLELQTERLGLLPEDALPASLRYSPPDEAAWEVADFDLPDISNPAAIVAPPATAEQNADPDAGPAAPSRLGLIILLADPGEADLKKWLAAWTQPAQAAGVIVCAIGPADQTRWTPEELDVPQRIAAAIRKSHPVEPLMQALGGAGEGPGGSLALAAAILRPGTFAGLSLSPQIRPPAIRLRENDPAAPLQLWLPPASDGEEGPGWAGSLEQLGYPVLRGPADPQAILTWVRSLTRI